jgi:anti-sigma factor RsiW
MMMKRFSCHDCREYLPAYISRDLPPTVRRRVGAHLDTCEACYTVYQRQREITHKLAQQVPLVGKADAPRLGKIWSAVQAEMTRPRRSSWNQIPRRHGVVILILVLVLLLPSLGFQALQRRVAMALPCRRHQPRQLTTSQAVAMAAEMWLRYWRVDDGSARYTFPAHGITRPMQPQQQRRNSR